MTRGSFITLVIWNRSRPSEHPQANQDAQLKIHTHLHTESQTHRDGVCGGNKLTPLEQETAVNHARNMPWNEFHAFWKVLFCGLRCGVACLEMKSHTADKPPEERAGASGVEPNSPTTTNCGALLSSPQMIFCGFRGSRHVLVDFFSWPSPFLLLLRKRWSCVLKSRPSFAVCTDTGIRRAPSAWPSLPA